MDRTLSEQIGLVFRELNNLGIGIKPGSRLDVLARVFRSEDGSSTMTVPIADHRRFKLALEALREFRLFEFILDPWEFGTETVALEKLRVAALKDHPLQYAQRRHETKGRDTQVELFIATAFRRTGACADLVRPPAGTKYPDIRTRACNRYFFIEAKRAKSRSAVVGAIADAVEQVNATGCPGAAFVDMTMAFNEEDHPANEHLRRSDVQLIHRAWLQGQFEPLRTEVDSIISGSRLTSIFFQNHLLIPIDGSVELHSTILTYPERVTGRYAREDRDIRRSLDLGWTRR